MLEETTECPIYPILAEFLNQHNSQTSEDCKKKKKLSVVYIKKLYLRSDVINSGA